MSSSTCVAVALAVFVCVTVEHLLKVCPIAMVLVRSQSSHPGRVVQVEENPTDSNKLLIAFSTGLLTLWDLKSKTADARFRYNEVSAFCSYACAILKHIYTVMCLLPTQS